jgi:hypothetical protein
MKRAVQLVAVLLAISGCQTQTTIVGGGRSDTEGGGDFHEDGVDGLCGQVTGVRFAKFSATCSVGNGNTLSPGCTWDITATPLMRGNVPAPLSIHGSEIEWVGTPGVAEVEPRGDNPFNKRIRIPQTAPVGDKVASLTGSVR